MKGQSRFVLKFGAWMIFLVALFSVWSDSHRLFTDLKFYGKCYRFMDSTLMAYCYEKLGLLFVVIEKSTGYYPLENLGDDLGIYYFFGMYSFWYRQIMGNYMGAYLALNVSGLLFFWFVNVLFIRKLSHDKSVRWMSVILISLFVLLCLFILDVYIWNVIFSSAILPFIYYFRKYRNEGNTQSWIIPLLVLVCGVILGMSNHIRANQSYAFVIVLAGFLAYDEKLKGSMKVILIFVLILGSLSSQILIQKYFENRMSFRDNILMTEYNYDIQSVRTGNTGHIIWHSLVLGVGFDIYNPKKIMWRDSFGFDLYEKEIKKSGMTTITKVTMNYETFMRNYYLDIWKEFPGYMIMHYLKKACYCLSFLILILNISLFKAGRFVLYSDASSNSKRQFIFLSTFFLASIGLGMVGAFLVFPMPGYALTGIYLSVLFSLWILHQANSISNSEKSK